MRCVQNSICAISSPIDVPPVGWRPNISALPVWFPEHARRALFYKRNWFEPQHYQPPYGFGPQSEGNINANQALTLP